MRKKKQTLIFQRCKRSLEKIDMLKKQPNEVKTMNVISFNKITQLRKRINNSRTQKQRFSKISVNEEVSYYDHYKKRQQAIKRMEGRMDSNQFIFFSRF